MALTKISTDGVKDDAITKTKIPANQIEASELADNAVDTNAIADDAVTAGKLANDIAINTTGNISGAAGTFTGDLTIPDKIVHAGDTDTAIRLGVDTVSVETAGSERLRVDSSGRVGIGDNSPDRELIVKNASSNSTVKIEASNAHTSQLFFSDTDAENVARISVFNGSGQATSNAMLFGLGGSTKMMLQTGGGISFNGDTAAANALDDYEEGTFVITAGGGSNATFNSNNNAGSYTKIGRQVTIAGQFLVDGGNNALRIGLPFSASAYTDDADMSFGASVIGYDYNAAGSTDCDGLFIMIDTGQAYARFMEHRDNSAWADLICDTDGYLRFTLTYFTA